MSVEVIPADGEAVNTGSVSVIVGSTQSDTWLKVILIPVDLSQAENIGSVSAGISARVIKG